MHAWEAIQNTLEYIEAHLPEELSIETLAGLAGLSPFYYQRLFKRLVSKPVMEYLKLRRLNQAAALLPDKNRRILDIALETGFFSHAALTRAFKEAYGLTPEQYRQNPQRLNQFNKPELLLQYVQVAENVPLIAESIVVEVQRRILKQPQYFRGYTVQVPIANQFPVGETTGPDLPGEAWEKLHASEASLPGLLPGGAQLGVSFESNLPGHFCYFAGAAVADDTVLPGYDHYVLHSGEYLACCFEAENFAALITEGIDQANKFMGAWLEQQGLEGEHWAAEYYFGYMPDVSSMEILLKTHPKQLP